MPLTLTADLDLEVDGIPGRLVCDGPAVVLSTPRPVAFSRAALSGHAADRDQLLSLLDQAPDGLPTTFVLRGPGGEVATIHRPQHQGTPTSALRVRLRPDRLVRPRTRFLIASVAFGLFAAAVHRRQA